jgi:hypothetical protein
MWSWEILLGAQRVSVHSLHLQAFLACLHGTLTRVLLVWIHKLLLTCGLCCCCGGGDDAGSMLLLLANHGLNVDSHVLLVLNLKNGLFLFLFGSFFAHYYSNQSFSIYLFSSMSRVFCVPLCYPGRYEMWLRMYVRYSMKFSLRLFLRSYLQPPTQASPLTILVCSK